jgi:DNA-binding HxlR family transcriptional regulator
MDTLIFDKKWNGKHQEILKVVSRSGVSPILFSLRRSPRRFSQLMFETRLNPGILNRHLKSLMELEIVEKDADSYVLTDTGKKIVSILDEIFSIVG